MYRRKYRYVMYKRFKCLEGSTNILCVIDIDECNKPVCIRKKKKDTRSVFLSFR